jgi:large subunit ribosomal protein L10
MPTQEKIQAVSGLKDRLQRATIVVSTEYRGLTVREMQDLRRKLREGGIEMRVIKNSLLKLAAEQAGQPEVAGIVEGPTALAISYGDVIDAARALISFAQTAPGAFKLRAGFMDGSVLTAADLKNLTTIPPKPVLLAMLMGAIEAPLANFVALLDGPLQELTQLFHSLLSELPGLIESRASQLEAAA